MACDAYSNRWDGKFRASFHILKLFTRFPQDIDCDVLPLSFHILKPKLTSISDVRCGHKFKISSDNLQMFNNHTVHNTDWHGSLLYCIQALNSVCEESTTTTTSLCHSISSSSGGGGGGGGGCGSGGGGGCGGSSISSSSDGSSRSRWKNTNKKSLNFPERHGRLQKLSTTSKVPSVDQGITNRDSCT